MPTATKRDGTDLRTPPAELQETATDVETPPVVEQPPATVHQLGVGAAQLAPVGYLGSRMEIQDELDRMAFAIRSFSLKQPDQVMREVAAYSARLTELAVLLHRVESIDRQYVRVRTQQVDRWQAELNLQFKIASRIVEIQRQDIDLMK